MSKHIIVGLLSLLPLSLLLSPASSCSLSVGSCIPGKCADLGKLTSAVTGTPAQYAFPYMNSATNAADKQIGFFAGLANTKAIINSSRGGAYINWQIFPYIGVKTEAAYPPISTWNVGSLPACCNKCAQTDGCKLYMWFSSNNLSEIYSIKGYKGVRDKSNAALKWPLGHVNNSDCYLLRGGSVNESATYGTPEGWIITSPWTPIHSQQLNNVTWSNYAPAWLGGNCNPNTGVTGDPHFVGAHGTKYEFNGAIDKTFALVSDEKLQINMKMGGYEDPRTAGAALVKNGMAIRTWIRELGFVWKDASGMNHSLILKCRTGAQQEIGSGYISSITLDGTDTPVPAVGDALKQQGMGLNLQRMEHIKQGPFDVDVFHLAVQDLVDLRMELRPAHPLLQTKEDAYVHFSIFLENLKFSKSVHGVLGQTFRGSTSQVVKALEYQLLAKLVRGPVVADSDSGYGFLDGNTDDYVVQDVLSTDFKYSAFLS